MAVGHPPPDDKATASTGPVRRGPRRFARGFYFVHRWVGVGATALLVIISVTGILLNHKRELGLMPDVVNEPTASLPQALALADLRDAAVQAAGEAAAAAGVDRMDVRPNDGLVKVRFDDTRVTEVTVDLFSGTVLNVGERNDVFLEKLHSGEIFGDLWVLLSDSGAIFLLALMVTGYWLWLYPKSRV